MSDPVSERETLHNLCLLQRLTAYKALQFLESGDPELAKEYLREGIRMTEDSLGLPPYGGSGK